MSERAETVHSAIVASAGLALGPLVVHHQAKRSARTPGSADQERSALRAALTQAEQELGALAESCDDAAAEIIEFQIALLDDEDLIDPIDAAIADGAAADAAWAEALDREIADYLDGDDEYFQARASDLTDLRERVLDALAGTAKVAPATTAPNAIYAADDLTPSRFLETDWARFAGAALVNGSASSHVAMLARARGVPMLVGLGGSVVETADGALAVLDAEAGRLVLDPSTATQQSARDRMAERARRAAEEARYLDRPAVTASGEHIEVLINVDDPAGLAALDPDHCDGIGLTRTEFLFEKSGGLPDEETQFRAYRDILAWAKGKPVTVRTLDAGGDKPIAGLTADGETNPFLGVRGLRLSLARPEAFRVQLRALARAAAGGALKVMVPMVTEPSEFRTFRDLFDTVLDELAHEGMASAKPDLGMMIEVPAAALTAERFEADFFSIGSNDLVQYVTATARDNAAVAALHDARNPAVLELIGRVVEAGRRIGAEVSLCGDMAGEPDLLPLLLETGLRTVSVSPARLATTKAAVARFGDTPPQASHG